MLNKQFFDNIKANETRNIVRKHISDLLLIEDCVCSQLEEIENDFSFDITKVDTTLYELDFSMDSSDIRFNGMINIL